MEPLKQYLKTRPHGELKRIEREIGRNYRYLARMIYGERKPNLVDALKIERATGGAVRREEILPDFDWSLLERNAGVKNFRIHDLRHTCAAWLVSAGVQLSAVRDLLGHSSVTMTEKYAHLAPENVRAAVERLEADSSRFGHAAIGKRLTLVG